MRRCGRGAHGPSYAPGREDFVAQRAFRNVVLPGGRARFGGISLPVPAAARPGLWRVKIDVFSPGWDRLWHWNDRAAAFLVR